MNWEPNDWRIDSSSERKMTVAFGYESEFVDWSPRQLMSLTEKPFVDKMRPDSSDILSGAISVEKSYFKNDGLLMTCILDALKQKDKFKIFFPIDPY